MLAPNPARGVKSAATCQHKTEMLISAREAQLAFVWRFALSGLNLVADIAQDQQFIGSGPAYFPMEAGRHLHQILDSPISAARIPGYDT